MKTLSVALLAFVLTACSGTRPVQLGSENSQFEPCPDKPNCVISLTDPNDEHYISPIKSSAASETLHKELVSIISKTERAEIIVDTPNYVYAEYTSELMGFVDDVEFLMNKEPNTIHVRSASRLGYRDFDVNRERIEAIREQLNK